MSDGDAEPRPVSIRALSKQFERGHVLALDDIDLDVGPASSSR